ncbi:hypothetical protein [Lichenicoccus sp.]|uniref:hypothetical protein n=1 Tax=Lichenicoccus sp. TaxID=2781899 RepID=UPI003D118154
MSEPRRLKVGAYVLAAGLLAGPSAQAIVVNTASAGYWTAFEGTANDGLSVCGVSTADNGGRTLSIKVFEKTKFVVVQIYKPSWQIPSGTQIPIRFVLGDHAPWNAQGFGNASMIQFNVMGPSIAEFEKEFRQAAVLQLSFEGGTEPEMVESLVGSRLVDDALVSCVRRRILPAQATQPFASNQAGPTQPFSPPQTPASPSQLVPTPAPAPLPADQSL